MSAQRVKPNEDENGVDLILIRAYLKLTPYERLISLQNAVRTIQKFKPMKREDFENTGWVSMTTTYVGDLPENNRPGGGGTYQTTVGFDPSEDHSGGPRPDKRSCAEVSELRKQIADLSAKLAAMTIRLENLERAEMLTRPIGSAL